MGKIANIVSFPSIGLACASELGLERVCRLWRWQRIDSSRSSYLAILFGAKQRGLSIQVCTLPNVHLQAVNRSFLEFAAVASGCFVGVLWRT